MLVFRGWDVCIPASCRILRDEAHTQKNSQVGKKGCFHCHWENARGPGPPVQSFDQTLQWKEKLWLKGNLYFWDPDSQLCLGRRGKGGGDGAERLCVQQNPGTQALISHYPVMGSQRARPVSRTVVLNFGCMLDSPGEH